MKPTTEIERPIGVFDSGIGGLTVFASISRLLPSESLLYLGDTARVPYGTRSAETVQRYARAVADHLWGEGIKALVVACNTATTYAIEVLSEAGALAGVPVLGVIKPGVKEAIAATRSGRVAVLGTDGTINGGRYQAHLRAGGVEVEPLACPLFVSLAEEGWTDGPIAKAVAERYLGELKSDPDTVILGCTHYPMLKGTIGEVLPGVTLIDSAEATARALKEQLTALNLLSASSSPGSHRFLVTDNLPRFIANGEAFLGRTPEPAQVVDLKEPSGLFSRAFDTAAERRRELP